MPSPTAPACPLTVVARGLCTLSDHELWWRYTELGGNRSQAALLEYLAGVATWRPFEHNVLVQALNECLWDLGHPSLAPYRPLQDERRPSIAEIEGSVERP